MSQRDLHVTELGREGPRLVFLHGLFGQGKNWTTIAKAFAADHRVLLVDMPNHGRSDWTDSLDYLDQADVVADLFDADDPVRLIGHSMGGKVAMTLALRRPELVERLVVVDIAPVTYPGGREFADYIAAMQAMDLAALDSREDAMAALEATEPSWTIRSFLLQNLRRTADGWRWQPNLDLLADGLDVLGGWPDERLAAAQPYQGQVLWVGGSDSDYVTDEYAEAMDRWFPRVRRVTVKRAGHWVHSQQPEVFTEVLRHFLDG